MVNNFLNTYYGPESLSLLLYMHDLNKSSKQPYSQLRKTSFSKFKELVQIAH